MFIHDLNIDRIRYLDQVEIKGNPEIFLILDLTISAEYATIKHQV